MLELGNYITGICRDFRSEPWTNDPTKFNHRLILVRPYADQYGNEQTDVTVVDVNQEDVQQVQSLVAKFRDKAVICPVVHSARAGGRNGAWLSTRLPKHAPIQLLDDVIKLPATDKKASNISVA